MFQISLFQTHPQLKQIVRPSIERAITEWIVPVVDRSVKIAITTSDQIVKKVGFLFLLIYFICFILLSKWYFVYLVLTVPKLL